MGPSKEACLLRSAFMTIALGLVASTAAAQITPAQGYTPPDDTPSTSVGATLYTNYSDQTQPNIVDADGNSVHKTFFEVTRSYINVTGRISHIINYRITPDITRGGGVSGSNAATDSLVFRLKYGYLQANLDDWMTRGSWVRFGMQQTPYIDYTEGIYRYRFQGTTFLERDGPGVGTSPGSYFASSDLGVGFHYNLPNNYGEIHTGYYDGENYQRPEVNDQKAFMIRATVRPFATGDPVLRGLRITGFYDTDHYVKNDARTRTVGQLTFEHQYVVIGFEDLFSAKDQITATNRDIKGNGYSIWATPKYPMENGSSWEILARYDHQTQDDSEDVVAGGNAAVPGTVLNDQKMNRTIFGVAYWFPHTGGPTSALLIDYDGQGFNDITTVPNHTISVHALVNF
jgi:hypothetical protein